LTTTTQAAPDAIEARYWRAMTEIKHRLAATDRLYIRTHELKPDDPAGEWLFTWEQIALHLRKIMELIVFGSLVAHSDAYASIYPDYADH
jgi:hypothetical protein